MILTVSSHPLLFGQGGFESRSSGDWGSSATWTLVSGSDGDGIPDANDSVRVLDLHTVNVGTSNRNCSNLRVDQGGTLLINTNRHVQINANPGYALINGTVTMSNTGRLQETGTGTRTLMIGPTGKITISGAATNPLFDIFSFDPSSTFEYSATSNQTVISGVVYGNITLGGSGTKTVGPIPSDTAFVSAGKATVGSAVTFDVSTNILYINFNGNVENNGIINAAVGTTVLYVRGAQWINNGTYLPSVTPGFGLQPTTTFVGTQLSGSTVSQGFFDVRFEGSVETSVRIDSARHMEISTGSTFDGGVGLNHSLTGNWTNNGSFVCATSALSFVGTSPQVVSGGVFHTVTVNNPNGIVLSSNMEIATGGSLTLAAGNIDMGSNTLFVSDPSPSALNPGSNEIFGTVRRAIASGSTSIYRFFKSNAFVIPGGVDNPTEITAVAFPNVNPPNLGPSADTNSIVKRYYSIQQTGAGSGFTFTLRLPYLQSEVRGNETNYVLWRFGSGGWTNVGASIADATNNYVEQSGLNAFSNWSIAEDNASLPIQLAHFSAQVQSSSGNVHLRWGTLSETNNYGFYVEVREASSSSFTTLANSFVPGNGTTLEPQEYSWVHVNVGPGEYFYRLKQLDLDGAIHYTDAIEVNVTGVTSAGDANVPHRFELQQNYPNPFNPSTTIRFSVEQKTFASLRVFDLLGQEVASLYHGEVSPGREYTILFNASDMPNGVYIYVLRTEEKSLTKKMLLLK